MSELYAASGEDAYYHQFRDALVGLADGVPASVLDVGCGAGEVLVHFRRLGTARTAGIELVPSAADVARGRPEVDEVVTGDFQTVPLPFADESFDLVVASHVLEHVTDPWRALDQLVRLVRPGGQLIGSLPNVRHHSVWRALVLHGEWRYVDEGILDRTHYRFFTRRSMVELLEGAGLVVERVVPEVAGPKSLVARRLTFGRVDDLLAYTYNFATRKPG
jgi:SAM-dependent methyltransferase